MYQNRKVDLFWPNQKFPAEAKQILIMPEKIIRPRYTQDFLGDYLNQWRSQNFCMEEVLENYEGGSIKKVKYFK